MIQLPSTTRVERKLPKEDFYRRLKLTGKQRDAFVRQIEGITIANSIKPTTMRVSDGAEVHEIFVIDLALKESCVPTQAIETIAKENPHKILFKSEFDGGEILSVYRQGKSWHTKWHPLDSEGVAIRGDNLDAIWDGICAQVIFDDSGIQDVDGELKKRQRLKSLDEEIAKLERTHGKERQLGKRNELFRMLQEARNEREAVLKG